MKINLTIALFLLFCLNLNGQENTIEERIIIKQLSTDKKYGKRKTASIKVGSIANEYAFLAQVTGPNGEKITYNRLGSCCAVKSKKAPMGKALLDKWEIRYEGLIKPIILYLNGYDFEKPKCPVGLNFTEL